MTHKRFLELKSLRDDAGLLGDVLAEAKLKGDIRAEAEKSLERINAHFLKELNDIINT